MSEIAIVLTIGGATACVVAALGALGYGIVSGHRSTRCLHASIRSLPR